MRTFIIFVLLIAVMVMAGWVVFNFGENTSSVEIRTDKIKQDTAEFMQKSERIVDEAEEELDANDGRPVYQQP